MRYRELIESPIDNLEVHHMDEPGTFPDADRKLLQNPAHLKKIVRQFANSDFTFNLYFVNQPGVSYTNPRDGGHDFTPRFYSDMEMSGEVTAAGMKDLFGIDIHPNPEVIAVVIASNANEIYSIPLTPWMVAHRIGHAIMDNPGDHPSFSFDFHSSISGFPGLTIAQCLTMRSARSNMMQSGEIPVEIITQYLLEGWVKLVAPPGFVTSITGRPVETILQQISWKIVRTLQDIFETYKGRVLLAV